MHRFANPLRYQRIADAVLPWAAGLAAVLGVLGLYLALVVAPPDYQQGEAYRIMFVHVPAAWMALMVYAMMAVASVVALVWRHPLAEVAARAAAPIGAAFTAIALVTGSLWGKPMWGTFWVWDARLTSVLILFFLYLGYIALHDAFDEPGAARAPPRSCAWSARSTCRSSSSRSTGGTPCTSRPRSCARTAPRSIRACSGHSW